MLKFLNQFNFSITILKLCFKFISLLMLCIFGYWSLSSLSLPFSYPGHLLDKIIFSFLFFFRILRSMDLPCSFKDPISSKICGKGRTSDDRVIPVSRCQRNILNHLFKYNLSKENIPTEADLIRLRGGFLMRLMSVFVLYIEQNLVHNGAVLHFAWWRQSVRKEIVKDHIKP